MMHLGNFMSANDLSGGGTSSPSTKILQKGTNVKTTLDNTMISMLSIKLFFSQINFPEIPLVLTQKLETEKFNSLNSCIFRAIFK